MICKIVRVWFVDWFIGDWLLAITLKSKVPVHGSTACSKLTTCLIQSTVFPYNYCIDVFVVRINLHACGSGCKESAHACYFHAQLAYASQQENDVMKSWRQQPPSECLHYVFFIGIIIALYVSCVVNMQLILICVYRWGCTHEKNRIQSYISSATTNHDGLRGGTFCGHGKTISGASPDSIINCNCCGNGVLEVKCLYH